MIRSVGGGLVIAAVAAFLTCEAKAEEAAYAAIYYRGSEQIVMNAQVTPIPVPQVGSRIEVYDQGTQLSGRVRSVSHEIRRQNGTPAFRFLY